MELFLQRLMVQPIREQLIFEEIGHSHQPMIFQMERIIFLYDLKIRQEILHLRFQTLSELL